MLILSLVIRMVFSQNRKQIPFENGSFGILDANNNYIFRPRWLSSAITLTLVQNTPRISVSLSLFIFNCFVFSSFSNYLPYRR